MTAPDFETPLADDDTVVFKRSHLYAALVPLAFILGLSVGFIFWCREPRSGTAPAGANQEGSAVAAEPSTAGSAANQPASGAATENNVPRFDIPVDDDPILGPEDAGRGEGTGRRLGPGGLEAPAVTVAAGTALEANGGVVHEADEQHRVAAEDAPTVPDEVGLVLGLALGRDWAP